MVLGSGSTLRELGRHFLSAGQPEIERDHFCQPQLSGWQLCHQTWFLAGDYTSVTSLLLLFSPAEFQRQESVRSQHKGIQLYDTPYEPEGQNVDSDSESTVSLRLRESKLPQDDDRPADEYDQPWEWNRVTIPALAGRSNGPAWEAGAEEHSAPAEVNKTQVGPVWPG